LGVDFDGWLSGKVDEKLFRCFISEWAAMLPNTQSVVERARVVAGCMSMDDDGSSSGE